MILRLYTPLFAFTLLISAILLFSVQPMFSKMILPLLGGTPQVWNTAMLFFQVTLLGGYAYAHGTTKFLSIRMQAIVHIVLLLLFTLVLPIAIPDGWSPPTDTDPTFWQLSLMAVSVGGPFFVLSGSAPMLQRWFAATDHPDAGNPYFLYGASNLGSMGALLAYPVIIEPLMDIDLQSSSWGIGYGVLIALTVLAFISVYKFAVQSSALKQKTSSTHKTAISWSMRLRWIFLAFLPSSMMLGVTTYITTDIASAPLLWILPLALYVGTFILVFSRKEIISANMASIVFMAFICLMFFQTISLKGGLSDPFLIIGLHFCIFFSAALLCHKELADSRPDASKLTEFYLLMSLGGALGGVFNAQIAPQLFVIAIEYAVVVGLISFVRFSSSPNHSFQSLFAFFKEAFATNDFSRFFEGNGMCFLIIVTCGVFAFFSTGNFVVVVFNFIIFICLINLIASRWAAAFSIVFLILLFPPGYMWGKQNYLILEQSRNFFGVLRVMDSADGERLLLHGTTNHGVQSLDAKYALEPLSYYSRQSPLRDVYDAIDTSPSPQKIGIVGLGVGATACYQKDERSYDFFEINPAVVEIAENDAFFTYLKDCGSPYDIILGDGRLTIQEKPQNYYDMILIDAFSSDSIPIHLLTVDAIKIYLNTLKDDGVLVFHIANRHVDLEPVLSLAAQELGVNVYGKAVLGGKLEGTNLGYYPTHYIAFTKSEEHDAFLRKNDWSDGRFRKGVKLWTDQYSNILSVFGVGVSQGRFVEFRIKRDLEKELTSSP